MDVAIVGAACRLPGGADTPERLWTLLRNGVDAVTEVPPDRFDAEALFDPDPAQPGRLYTREGGFLDAIDGFDADFFGISPREARRLDPQQRLLLEVTWEALEDGGEPPDRLAGSSTGVFVGASTHDYADIQGYPAMRDHLDAYVATGGAMSVLANRISYTFDLRGPSLVVDTACSSSLTALHLACRSLRGDECERAIVAGVSVILSPVATIMFCKASMLSPDGRCKPFDASANGYVRSEGAGAVVLKPLARALADRDPIYAVVRSTAANQDGRTAGISVPNPEAQQRLLRQALAEAGIAPTDVQYVEAHGTGTPVGDPREATAIGGVYGVGRPSEQPCLLGSIKSNVGHLEAAAGIAGLLKVALALRHRRIPASLHFTEANPAIDLDALGLRVVTATQPWPAAAGHAVAGVNSFGFGGANAHAIVAEAPLQVPSPGDVEPTHRILTLSARTGRALRDLAAAWVERLDDPGPPTLRNLCYTAAVRRSHHDHRLAVVADSRDAAVDRLHAFLADEPHPGAVTGRAASNPRRCVFVFAGMGPQSAGMGRQLLERESAFREAVEACDAALAAFADWSLIDELGAPDGSAPIRSDRVHVTNLALQVGLAALWRSWGVLPDAIVGHSSGETGAACVAGALELADAVRLAFHRGRLLHTAAGTGGMLAAAVPPAVAEDLLAGREELVSVAAHNAPASVTFSGDLDALRDVAVRLEADGRWCRELTVDIPYHAPQLDALEEGLLAGLAGLRPQRPSVPLVSTTTGTWVDGPTLDAAHWWRNLRQPVLFAPAIKCLVDSGHDIFVELGPHPVLTPSVQQCLSAHGATGTVLPTLRRDDHDQEAMLRALAALYTEGRDIDWAALHDDDASCVTVPGYPWQRERHWIDERAASVPEPRNAAPLPGRRLRAVVPTWECDLGDARMSYLDDHIVRDTATFPGAGHVVFSLAATAAVQGGGPVCLEDVTFDSLLALDERADTLLQCVVDPATGAVTVHSGRRPDVTAWKLRASATLRRSPDAAAPVDLETVRARCPTTVPVDRFYQEADSYLGLTYRGAFRSIAELRFGRGEALARVAADPMPDRKQQPIHPALLDAAFQALLAAHRSRADSGLEPGVTILPTGLERVEWHRPLDGPFWSHARVDGRRDDVLDGTVELIDDDGNVALRCSGLRLRVLQQPRPRIGDCLLEEVWEVLPESPTGGFSEATPARVAEVVEAELARLAARSGFSGYYEDVEAALDAVASRLLGQALATLGGDGDHDDGGLAPAVRGSVVPRHHRHLERLLALRGAQPPREGGIDGVLEDPALRPAVELVRGSGERLAATLRGDEDPRRWLIAGEAAGTLADFYTSTPIAGFYNAALAEAVAAVRPSGRKLRVLEVGAGTGGTTAAVLDRLDGAIDDYLVTDVSPYFVKHARKRFGHRAGLRFAVLDLEQPLDEVEQRFDVVIAAGVIHATADVRATLGKLRNVLVPGGYAALLEPIRWPLWLQLIFGQMEGWWSFADAELRSTGPLLSVPRWREVLREAGFGRIAAVSDTPHDGSQPMEALLLAQLEGTADSASEHPDAALRRWIVLADDRGVGPRVAAGLRARGDRCVTVRPSTGYDRRDADRIQLDPASEDDWRRLLQDVQDDQSGPLHVLNLWALDAPPNDVLDAAAMLDVQDLGCGAVVTLMRAMHQSRLALGDVAVVTAAAQQAPGQDGALNMAQTPVWGLARVLRNERRAQRCITVDLSDAADDDEIAQLVEALAGGGPTEHTELLLRGRARYGRRLRAPTLAATEQPRRRRVAPRDAPLRLAVGTPGELASLRLEEGERHSLRPGQVEIRVHAAALNFRDVMVALGVLGHDGRHRPLGLDCAGVVTAADGANGPRPGDEVIALGQGMLASRVVTDAELVAPKPPDLSFAQAATLPVVFVVAHGSLHGMAAMAAGERVLIHTASGGVGLAALQLCQRVGAEVFATAGTPDKRALLRSLGVEHVMDSRSLDFADEIRDATQGQGVDIVLNSLAGAGRSHSLALLRPSGRFIDMAVRDMLEDSVVGLSHFARGLSYHAFGEADSYPVTWGDYLRAVADDATVGTLRPLPSTEYDLSDAEAAFRLMAQAKHVGKVVCTVEEPHYWVTPPSRALFAADGTYLLAGGLGGFGLATARWMVRRGARHLVLTSRTGRPRPEDEDALDALRATGARVTTVAADAADRETMRTVIASIRAEMPPLKGVVHAAMTLDDDLLGRLDRDRFRAVLAPKVAGAWNLHELTLEDDLDHFLLFSSFSSVVGVPAQSSYAAANTFLDVLSAHRRGLGLPALTVNWGAVAGVGYVARHPELVDRSEGMRRAAQSMLSPDVAFAALERAMGNALQRVAIAQGDWFLRYRSSDGHGVSDVADVTTTTEALDGGEETDRAAARSSGVPDHFTDDGADTLQTLVQRTALVFDTAPDRLDPDRSLTDMGLDSLMAVELQTMIKKDLGIEVPIVDLLEGATLRSLADEVERSTVGRMVEAES